MSILDWAKKRFSGNSVSTLEDDKSFNYNTSLRCLLKANNLVDCLHVYVSAQEGSDIERLAIDKVQKIARNFKDWVAIYKFVSPVSLLGISAFNSLLAMANTFEDWIEIYYLSGLETGGRETVINKLVLLADSRARQIKLFELVLDGSAVRKIMFERLCLGVRGFNDWVILFDSLSYSEFKKTAAAKMIELAPNDVLNFERLLSHDFIISDDELREMVLNRVRALNLSFTGWMDVISDDSLNDYIKGVAIEEITKDHTVSYGGTEIWEIIMNASEYGSRTEKLAAEKVVEKVPSNDIFKIEKLLRYAIISVDQRLRKAVLDKLCAVPASQFEAWKELYENDETDEDASLIALDKMIESIDSIGRLEGVDGCVREDDEDECFCAKIELKAKTFLVSREACFNITRDYYAEGPIAKTALVWLVSNSATSRECIDIVFMLYDDWTDSNGEVNRDFLKIAIKRLMKIATESEIYIISKLSSDFALLGEAANDKIGYFNH